jgi:osmoprotectant transport system permease protein
VSAVPSVIAQVHQPLIRWGYIPDHLGLIRSALVQHLELTFIAVSVGFVIASVFAAIALRLRLTYQPVNLAMGIAYAVPSIALFILLAPVTGFSTLTAEIALVSYTLQILFRSIVAGIDGVPASVRESAAAMGYTRRQQRWRVEVPLALPVIMSGLRIATVTTVGLVPIAGILGADQGGLGRFIFDGLDRFFNTPLLIGGVLTVVLAVTLDVLIVQIERLLTPWTRRVRAS